MVRLLDVETALPDATGRSFWLAWSSWPFPEEGYFDQPHLTWLGWSWAKYGTSGGALYPFSDPDGNGWTLRQLPY